MLSDVTNFIHQGILGSNPTHAGFPKDVHQVKLSCAY